MDWPTNVEVLHEENITCSGTEDNTTTPVLKDPKLVRNWRRVQMPVQTPSGMLELGVDRD